MKMKAILILMALLSFSACSTKGKIFVNEQAGRLADKEAYEAELERLEEEFLTTDGHR